MEVCLSGLRIKHFFYPKHRCFKYKFFQGGDHVAVKVAKIAVSAALYYLDRPYDYLIPQEFADAAVTGARVLVPFGRGNRHCEGIILALSEDSEYDKLKSIISVLDETPLLSDEQIKMALFMRERFFCTVYDAVKAMLPAGLWLNEDGKRRINDKYIEMAKLLLSPEDAQILADNKRRRSVQQANIIEMLCGFECLPSKELLRFTGASRQALTALKKAEVIELYKKEVYRRPEIYTDEIVLPPQLNDEQKKAFQGISALADRKKAQVALLFGVTGSGKTSVYIHLIKEQIEKGKGALLLVPEISLTPQMIQTFSSHFGDTVAVLHSSLSVGERADEWKRIKRGEAKLAIGTRSAVFAPVQNLGIIIIDEEQEETYKSENTPRYNAIDIAKYRCIRENCLLLLGSATPNVVSRYKAETGVYSYFSLPNRFNERELPEVQIVDMKKELRNGNGGNISRPLYNALKENVEKGEQSILFINRRGANKLISCGDCGYTYKCPNCSVPLTYHSSNNRLMCHYCGYSKPIDRACPECGGILKRVGAGTQLVEDELKELFPDIEILRMDTDSVAPVGSHEELFDRFKNENIPIMVGTQMVTKGLNFENVTLVGVISADQSLYIGDYRAGERTFSLITQVVGRSGRGEKPGRAIIQTFTPENETIIQAANQDYEDFYAAEIQLRQLQNAPPFSDFLSITASGQNEGEVVKACRDIRHMLVNSTVGNKLNVLGPTPLSVVKVNNRYRYRVNISCCINSEIRSVISQILLECGTNKNFKGVSVFADNDPMD